MRKLIALLTLIVLCILPATHVFAAPEIHFDSLAIPDGLFEKQSFEQRRNILLNELINQLHLYEQYFGKMTFAPGIKVILSGNDMPNFNPDKPLVTGNTIYLIQTSDDYSNIGKFNTIFEQLIFINKPNADFESAKIISSFLKFKYYGVNVSKIAGLYRYCFPNQYLYDYCLKSCYSHPLNQTVKMLAVAKISELDARSDPKLISFISNCIENGIFEACEKNYSEFPIFIRSARTSIPNTKIKDVLIEVENKRKQIAASMHFRPNKTDIQLHLDAMKDLDTALMFISQDDDVKSNLALGKIDTYQENIVALEKTWWIILAAMILVLMSCFLYVHNRLLLANTIDVESIPNVVVGKQTKKAQATQQTNPSNKPERQEATLQASAPSPIMQEPSTELSQVNEPIESIQESIVVIPSQPVELPTVSQESKPKTSSKRKRIEEAIEKIEKAKSSNTGSSSKKSPGKAKPTNTPSKTDKKPPSKRKTSK